MSKAIYVLDAMPANCKECPLTTCGNDIFMIGTEERPMVCPLKEMPEHETRWAGESWEAGYKEGWNACLDKIGGTDERQEA